MPLNINQLVVALALMPSAIGHLCVWEPMQRGDFSIDIPGSHDCYRLAGPCGGQDAGTTITSLNGGSSYDVHFQQNLNHYATTEPGSLVIDYAVGSSPEEADFVSLDGGEAFADYNAMNMITETNFTRTVTIPDVDADAAVIRVRYISNNPGEETATGSTFYQCSDVSVVSSATSGIAPVLKKATQPVNKGAPIFHPTVKAKKDEDDDGVDHSCCAPSTFSITYQTDPIGGGVIFYDSDSSLMRVDYTSPGTDYSMFLNFSSGIEWLFNPVDGSCTEYGLDPWVEWCFGSEGYSETFMATGECGDPINEDCVGFTNGDWEIVATSDECYPAMINGSKGNAPHMVFYYAGEPGPLDAGVFYPPCQETITVGGPAPLSIEAVRATPAFHVKSHAPTLKKKHN